MIKATIGRKINWLIRPIIKFLGVFATLAKSEKVKPKPKVNIIKAKAKGRITSVMKFMDKQYQIPQIIISHNQGFFPHNPQAPLDTPQF